MARQAAKIYQLKIILEGSKPPIWRRVLVKSSDKLAQLHPLIQIAMGWENSHLHHFMHQGTFYSEPSPFDDDFMDSEDATKYRIDQLLQSEKDWMRYEYDFGDGWLHKILLEKVMPLSKETTLPQCIKGKMACPPEDIGGVWGYESFLETMADKDHPEHKAMLDWMGGELFDPNAFDLDGVNETLREVWR